MTIALWVFGLLCLALGCTSFGLWQVADRPGDDFGWGMLAWVSMALAVILFLVWLMLAALHWGAGA